MNKISISQYSCEVPIIFIIKAFRIIHVIHHSGVTSTVRGKMHHSLHAIISSKLSYFSQKNCTETNITVTIQSPSSGMQAYFSRLLYFCINTKEGGCNKTSTSITFYLVS